MPAVFDEEGNLIEGKGDDIEALPSVDHGGIAYEPFRRTFYSECPDVRGWRDDLVAAFRSELGIVASGHDVVKPIQSFMQAGPRVGVTLSACACV